MPVNTQEEVKLTKFQAVLEIDDHLLSIRCGNKVAGYLIAEGWESLTRELRGEVLHLAVKSMEVALKQDKIKKGVVAKEN